MNSSGTVDHLLDVGQRFREDLLAVCDAELSSRSREFLEDLVLNSALRLRRLEDRCEGVLAMRISFGWASAVRGTSRLIDSYGGGSMDDNTRGVDLTLRFLELLCPIVLVWRKAERLYD